MYKYKISFELSQEEINFLDNEESEVLKRTEENKEMFDRLMELGLIEQSGRGWDKFYHISDFGENVIIAINSNIQSIIKVEKI